METVKIEVPVSIEWIDFATQSSNIFRINYCGYWMYGMEHNGNLGWLCYVHDEEKTVRQVSQIPEYQDIVAKWKAGEPLPKGWHCLNKDSALRAFSEGVKAKGAFWYKDGDARDYDEAIQRAFFGEVLYG